ncbi:TPA: hypothetical protein ACX6PV_003795 [Photobacterium damselae]
MEIDYKKVCARRLYNNKITHIIKIIIYVLFYEIKINVDRKSKNDKTLCVYSVDTIGPIHLENLRESVFFNKGNVIFLGQSFSAFRPISIFKQYLLNDKKYIGCLSGFFSLKYKVDLRKIKEEINIDDYFSLITICDNTPYENLITQWFNSKNKITYTNQHGLYSYCGDQFNSNRTLYESLVSDYLLSWGEATKVELSQFNDINFGFISIGNHTIDNNIISELNTLNNDEKNCFGVILNGEVQREFNFKLISIAKELSQITGDKFIIRMHPNNNVTDYINLVGDNCLSISRYNDIDYFSKVDFSLAHSTGLFALCMYIKHKIYLLDEELSKQFKIKNINFINVSELNLIIKDDYNFDGLSVYFNGIYKKLDFI